MGLGVLTTSNCCTGKGRKDIKYNYQYVSKQAYDSSTVCFYIIPHSYKMPCWVLTTPYIVCWTGAMSSAACKNLTVKISHTLLTFTWTNQNSCFSIFKFNIHVSQSLCLFLLNFERTYDLSNHSIFLGDVFQHTKPKLIKISKPPVIMISMCLYSINDRKYSNLLILIKKWSFVQFQIRK